MPDLETREDTLKSPASSAYRSMEMRVLQPL